MIYPYNNIRVAIIQILDKPKLNYSRLSSWYGNLHVFTLLYFYSFIIIYRAVTGSRYPYEISLF